MAGRVAFPLSSSEVSRPHGVALAGHLDPARAMPSGRRIDRLQRAP